MGVGRPTKMTVKTLEILERGFLQGLSDEEACLYAKIDPSTLYNYCAKVPNFASRKELLKNRPKMLAKVNINKSLETGDVNTSKWFLERKDKDYYPKQSDETELEKQRLERLDKMADYIKAILSTPDLPEKVATISI